MVPEPDPKPVLTLASTTHTHTHTQNTLIIYVSQVHSGFLTSSGKVELTAHHGSLHGAPAVVADGVPLLQPADLHTTLVVVGASHKPHVSISTSNYRQAFNFSTQI